MTDSSDNPVSLTERKLRFYQQQCNELGASLMRSQEEQSQAVLEARRSRTVVRLVRELYRLAEPAQAMDDVGGALLQIVVENALCDRAALLREEPLGSHSFMVAHAIGGTKIHAEQVIAIDDPPAFCFTSSHHAGNPPAGLLSVLQLPFVLWAYDPSSGHALVIGNRSEGNVSRPFEDGDQELIEAALSVYLDILYRKHAEAQLRHAKQAAEEASLAQARFLEALSTQLRPPVTRIASLLNTMAFNPDATARPEQIQAATRQLIECSRALLALTDDALCLATPWSHTSFLDVRWLAAQDVMVRVLRSCYPLSVRRDVELKLAPSRRTISICVDFESMIRAMQEIVGVALARAMPGSAVTLSAERRGDGGVGLLVASPVEIVPAEPTRSLSTDAAPGVVGGLLPRTDHLASARRIVEAHGGVLVLETWADEGSQARIILPARMTRDDTGKL